MGDFIASKSTGQVQNEGPDLRISADARTCCGGMMHKPPGPQSHLVNGARLAKLFLHQFGQQ
jgi:hypothetical protein